MYQQMAGSMDVFSPSVYAAVEYYTRTGLVLGRDFHVFDRGTYQCLCYYA